MGHLFFSCPISNSFWNLHEVRDWISPPWSFTNVCDFLQDTNPKTRLQPFIFMFWSIWKERNALIFNNDIWLSLRIPHRTKFALSKWTSGLHVDLCHAQGSPTTRAFPLSFPLPSGLPAYLGSLLLQPPSSSTSMVQFVALRQQQASSFGIIGVLS